MSFSVNLVCVQESDLKSSSSFQISGFYALRFDSTHSRSGILSHDATNASGGIIIFVLQGLSFSELSNSSLSVLDPYPDYAGDNISLNNSSSPSFLNDYTLLICSSPTGSRTVFLFPLLFPPPEISSF